MGDVPAAGHFCAGAARGTGASSSRAAGAPRGADSEFIVGRSARIDLAGSDRRRTDLGLSYWGALAGLILGPIVVIYAVLTEPFSQTLIVTLGVLAFVGGFALLLWRQPARREDFGHDDDGSRV